jgi:hypothetical protein
MNQQFTCYSAKTYFSCISLKKNVWKTSCRSQWDQYSVPRTNSCTVSLLFSVKWVLPWIDRRRNEISSTDFHYSLHVKINRDVFSCFGAESCGQTRRHQWHFVWRWHTADLPIPVKPTVLGTLSSYTYHTPTYAQPSGHDLKTAQCIPCFKPFSVNISTVHTFVAQSERILQEIVFVCLTVLPSPKIILEFRLNFVFVSNTKSCRMNSILMHAALL